MNIPNSHNILLYIHDTTHFTSHIQSHLGPLTQITVVTAQEVFMNQEKFSNLLN